jgi:hypothetical protein
VERFSASAQNIKYKIRPLSHDKKSQALPFSMFIFKTRTMRKSKKTDN